MKTLDQIRQILTQKKPILAKAGIKEIGVFGSFVRGEQQPDSDLDILIDIERPATMDILTLITLEQELSEDLGLPYGQHWGRPSFPRFNTFENRIQRPSTQLFDAWKWLVRLLNEYRKTIGKYILKSPGKPCMECGTA